MVCLRGSAQSGSVDARSVATAATRQGRSTHLIQIQPPKFCAAAARCRRKFIDFPIREP
jgi:hypothetical protein